jgi:hypothetical protein
MPSRIWSKQNSLEMAATLIRNLGMDENPRATFKQIFFPWELLSKGGNFWDRG